MDRKYFKDLKVVKTQNKTPDSLEDQEILCTHCKRTRENKIPCIGKCVSDNEYQDSKEFSFIKEIKNIKLKLN